MTGLLGNVTGRQGDERFGSMVSDRRERNIKSSGGNGFIDAGSQ